MILSCDRVSLCCCVVTCILLACWYVSANRLAAVFPCIKVSSCISVILEYLEPSSLNCFVRRHSFFPSFSIFKSAVLDIQLFLLPSSLALINFAFTCFSAVLLSDVGSSWILRSSLQELVVGVLDYRDSLTHCLLVEFQIVAVNELWALDVPYHPQSYQPEECILHLVHWLCH